MTNVNDMMKQVNEGFARPNRYKVIINLPLGVYGLLSSSGLDKTIDDYVSTSAIGGIAGQITGSIKGLVNIPSTQDLLNFGLDKAGVSTNNICFNCESTQLPGLTMAVSERYTYGPSRKFPFREVYEEQPFGFYCSKDHKEKVFFDMWFSMMFNRDTHDMNFSDEYKSTLYVSQLDYNGNETYKVKFIDAYPIGISPVSLSYGDDNSIERFTVNFAFTKWEPILLDVLSGTNNIGTVIKTII